MRIHICSTIARALCASFATKARAQQELAQPQLYQRQLEQLDRGLVAINQGADVGVFLSWRPLSTEPRDLDFNVYRQTGNVEPQKRR